jgi:hypothetical protein
MYNPPTPEKPPPWWLESYLFIRAVFGILVWPILAIIVGVGGVFALFFLFTLHWLFGLLFLGLIVGAFVAFAIWEKRHSPPPIV